MGLDEFKFLVENFYDKPLVLSGIEITKEKMIDILDEQSDD